MNKERELIILKPGRQSDPDFELISRHWNDNGVFCFAVFPRVSGAAFTTLHFLRILQMAQQARVLHFIRLEGLSRANTLAYWAHS
jgi:hypothetical protein